MDLWENTFLLNSNWHTEIYIHENAFENTVSAITSILFTPKCVNISRPSHYLNQSCWHFVNWTHGNKSQCNLNKDEKNSCKEINLKIKPAKCRPFCNRLYVLKDVWQCPITVVIDAFKWVTCNTLNPEQYAHLLKDFISSLNVINLVYHNGISLKCVPREFRFWWTIRIALSYGFDT